MQIALCSPSANAYSETFIKAHREGLSGNVHYYYDGFLPRVLDGKGSLLQFDVKSRLKRRFATERGLDNESEALAQSFAEQEVDVVLAEYGPTGAKLLPVCEALGIPLVVHFHGYDASQYRTLERYEQAYKAMFDKAAAIVVVSKKMRQMLIESGAPSSKLNLIYYGPDPLFYKIDRKAWQGNSMLFIGRFVDKKAPYYTLLAFKKALESGVDASLTMAGDGPLLPTITNMVKHFGLTDKVNLPGAVDHAGVQQLMASHSMYVQHSIRAESGDMEGTPVAIIEACAAALPVISTRHAGIPDVIVEGKTGLLVDEHDVNGMAQHMIDLCSDNERAFNMGHDSRAHIRQTVSRELNIQQLDALVTRVYQEKL